jgi:hypothetical protein
MDDPSSTCKSGSIRFLLQKLSLFLFLYLVIGQFGHCNQELINLLLTGQAVSNVFDGEMALGEDSGGMKVTGIKKRSAIGYLTHLEALRYCQVGNHYKTPKFPIWVIGSSSHFTVLFSLEKEVNEETNSEKLFAMLQRCFKSVDQDECGYIPSSKLYDVSYKKVTFIFLLICFSKK